MKKNYFKDLLVFICMLIILFLITFFIPKNIPVHYNIYGKVDIIVNKYYILLAVIIPYSAYWQFFRNKH